MDKQESLTEILDCLNETKMRATYGAVGDYIGIVARGVSQNLGEPCHRESWIVDKQTHLPSNYPPECIHPELKRVSIIIDTRDKLDRGLQRWRMLRAEAAQSD